MKYSPILTLGLLAAASPAFCAEARAAGTGDAVVGVSVAQADSPRRVVSLDGPGWRVWLDEKAEWKNDALHAPGEVPPLAQLPVNAPTGGWDVLGKAGRPCATPACIEQIFAKGDPGYQYHGVSWFSRKVEIPAAWNGKTLRLSIARAHLRVEVYVDGKLAGYDLCCESDCAFDLTPFLDAGKTHDLAIRVTNPGGSRGFNDCVLTQWGDKRLPSGRDYGGLDTVTLTATSPVHADNVFVMNQLPAKGNCIRIIPTMANPTGAPVEAEFTAEILPVAGGAPLHTQTWKATVPTGGGETPSPVFAVPGAKVWSVESPALHTCRLTVKTGKCADNVDTRFGFRVFEVGPRAEDGKACFLLNGQRFRHRSAIDFGFYAHTGLFASAEQVRRSIQAAKDIGNNGINLHRHIGEFRMLDAADEMGLAMYEEPGGLHQGPKEETVVRGSLADKVIQEKIRRMATRGRNHPSLLIHNLSNEDNRWNATREEALEAVHRINPAVFVCNASGETNANQTGPNRHFLPYGAKMQVNGFSDVHTVGSSARFQEKDLASHPDSKKLFYYGEVGCYCGPANWWLSTKQANEVEGSCDLASYKPNHDRIEKAFTDWNLAGVGSRLIKTPSDVALQAGRSLMYIDGRLSQRVMSRDGVDGFAMNGWSAHNYCTPASCTPAFDAWDSAIVDADRNLKGPAEDYRYYTRTAQVAIFRRGSKYVKPGDTANFEIRLVNERRIPAGDYRLTLSVIDGAGNKTGFAETRPVTVRSGDIFAQDFGSAVVKVESGWHAGHLTLCAELKDAAGNTVTDGKEQVLLKNRASWQPDLADAKLAVVAWPAADAALKEAKLAAVPADAADIILAASPAPKAPAIDTAKLLEQVKSGKTLVIRFDAAWAKSLHENGILTAPVTAWGGAQTGDSTGWFGNGWGYFDHFTGDQGVPAKTTLGTNGWEVPGNPVGFHPFVSQHKLSAYGLHFSRHPQHTEPPYPNPSEFYKACAATDGIGDLNRPTLFVLLGAIDYGRGKILLAPSYPVDGNNAFNDMLFFNMIRRASKNNW